MPPKLISDATRALRGQQRVHSRERKAGRERENGRESMVVVEKEKGGCRKGSSSRTAAS